MKRARSFRVEEDEAVAVKDFLRERRAKVKELCRVVAEVASKNTRGVKLEYKDFEETRARVDY